MVQGWSGFSGVKISSLMRRRLEPSTSALAAVLGQYLGSVPLGVLESVFSEQNASLSCTLRRFLLIRTSWNTKWAALVCLQTRIWLVGSISSFSLNTLWCPLWCSGWIWAWTLVVLCNKILFKKITDVKEQRKCERLWRCPAVAFVSLLMDSWKPSCWSFLLKK